MSNVRLVLVTVCCLLSACASGPMQVEETHYYAVPNDKHTNYYRVKVNAQTTLGDAWFREGWFPADAVDAVFGDVSKDLPGATLEAQIELKKSLRASILAGQKAWLEEAAKPDADPARLESLMEARRRILAYPIGPTFGDAIEVEYNPEKGIAIFHWGEKLVYVLSSNPDEVVGVIANFAESDRTAYSINQFATIVTQRTYNEVADAQARESVRNVQDAALLTGLQTSLGRLPASSAQVTKDQILHESEFLLRLLRSGR